MSRKLFSFLTLAVMCVCMAFPVSAEADTQVMPMPRKPDNPNARYINYTFDRILSVDEVVVSYQYEIRASDTEVYLYTYKTNDIYQQYSVSLYGSNTIGVDGTRIVTITGGPHAKSYVWTNAQQYRYYRIIIKNLSAGYPIRATVNWWGE